MQKSARHVDRNCTDAFACSDSDVSTFIDKKAFRIHLAGCAIAEIAVRPGGFDAVVACEESLSCIFPLGYKLHCSIK